MKKTVPVKQAAMEMGLSPQAVKERMKAGIIDIGDVVPAVKTNRKDRQKVGKSERKWRYDIYRPKLDKWLIERGLKDEATKE